MDLETGPSTTHPNPQPDLHHRKVDLQSTHDLIYLQSNLAKSAQQKLDLHFPKISKPATHISLDGRKEGNSTINNDTRVKTQQQEEEEDVADEEDPMRRQVRDLLGEFLQTMWTSAGQNISVNGIDASNLAIPHTATMTQPKNKNKDKNTPQSLSNPDPSQKQEERENDEEEQGIEGIHFTYSTFDPALQHKLASLHGELESLTAQVSRLRRTAPAEGAEIAQRRLREVLDQDEMRHGGELQKMLDGEQETLGGMDIDEVRDGWNEDVREVYARGIEELARLAGMNRGGSDATTTTAAAAAVPSLTETVGKAQRANRVVMELE